MKKLCGKWIRMKNDKSVNTYYYNQLNKQQVKMEEAKESLDEGDALRAITIDAAYICRVDHRLGSLKPGKDADIVIYDGNPLEIASSVQATIINGEIVWSPMEK